MTAEIEAPLPPRVAAVLFDLDGTLVDTVPDLAASVDETLRRLGRPAAGSGAVRDWVGNGVERLVARALTGTLAGDAEPALVADTLAVFLERYRDNNGRRSVVYPGVRCCLERLAAHRVPLGCVTNKPRAFTLPLLEACGLLAHFQTVVSGDDAVAKKPDPAPLLLAAERLGARPEATVFVGDSRHDVQAARAAGMAVVCVPYGYNHGTPIEEATPDLVVASLEDLPGCLHVAGPTSEGGG